MIFTKTTIHKLIIIALSLCCLITSVCGGKLSQTRAIVNGTEAVALPKKDMSKIETKIDLKTTEIKSSGGEEDDEEEEDEGNDTAYNGNEPAVKNAVQPAADTSLSVWSIVNRLWNWIREDISESLFSDDGKTSAVAEGRTFGKIRRLQMALIPIVFKFGVLSAMMAFMVAIGVKTLFLVKVLIVMNLLALLAKFFTLKHNFGHVEHFPAPPAPVWSPYVNSGWHSAPEAHHSNKEIHLHIHGGHLEQGHAYGNIATGKSQGWEQRSDPYSAYDTIALQGKQNELLPSELTTSGNSLAGSDTFLGNHRMF